MELAMRSKLIRTGRDMKKLRARLDLRQQDLADQLGTTVAAIAHWESNRRQIGPWIARLCFYLEKYGPVP
jgi:transcriptional regulator with XRE-family HTH domain